LLATDLIGQKGYFAVSVDVFVVFELKLFISLYMTKLFEDPVPLLHQLGHHSCPMLVRGVFGLPGMLVYQRFVILLLHLE